MVSEALRERRGDPRGPGSRREAANDRTVARFSARLRRVRRGSGQRRYDFV